MSEVRISQVLELRDGQAFIVVTRLGWEDVAEQLQSLIGGNMGIPLDMVKVARAPKGAESEYMPRFYLNELDAYPTSYNLLRFMAHMWEAAARWYKDGLDQVVRHYNSDDWSIETFEQYGPLFKRLGYRVVDPELKSPNVRIEGMEHEGKSVVIWADVRNFKVLHAEYLHTDPNQQALSSSSMRSLESRLESNHVFFDEVVALVTGKPAPAGIAINAFYEPEDGREFVVHQQLMDSDHAVITCKKKRYKCWTASEARRRFVWDMRSEGFDRPLCEVMKALDLTSDLLIEEAT